MATPPARILVVDDEPQVLELVRCLLEEEGHEVSTAAGGAEALDLIGLSRPDLVILDLMMPGMSGEEVCARLKADPSTCDIPVVVLTGKRSESAAVNSFELGAADYVRKPFGPKELIARVEARLKASM